MTQGRISRAQREHLAVMGDAEVVEPPPPLPELTPAEAQEWRALCAAVPAGYFKPVSFALLGALCRHQATAKHLAKLIHRERSFSTNFLRLIREHRAETAAIITCLRSLRLTPLANYPRDRGGVPEAPVPKPWLS